MLPMPASQKEVSRCSVPFWRRVRSLLAAVLVGLLASGGSASALAPDKSPRQFPHKAWQTADGLPQNSVLFLAQTPDGYLWGSTWEGLVRFDGVRFTVFNKANTPALQSRNVQDLAVSRDGSLWIALEKGLVRMRDGVFLPIVLPEGTVLAQPQQLLATRDGSLWIATGEHGLTRLSEEGRFQTWRKASGLASDETLALAEDGAGRLWVASTGGLQRWDGSAWTAPLPFEEGPEGVVDELVVDGEGTLWAGSEQGMVYRLQEGVMRRVPEASQPGSPISVMLVDREGSLWVGSLGEGVRRISRGQVSVLEEGHPLAHSLVSDLLEDAEGNLWLGTEARGLHRLQDAPFTTLGPPEGLAHEMVLAVHEARDGSLWFATVGGGVSRMRDGQVTSWSTGDGLLLDRVRSIAETPDGSLWFGTRVGISRWSAGTFTSFGAEQGLGDPRAFLLAVDAAGTLWVGTPSGLFRWGGARFEPFPPPGGLPGHEISLLKPSAAGGLWVGTRGGELVHLLAGRATVWVAKDAPLDGKTLALHEEADGTLWIGSGEGFYRWKAGRLRRFTSAEGLFDERSFHILSDGRGHLWMSGNRGVFRVSLAELEDVAEGRRASVTSFVYGTEDGMRSEECNGLGSPAGLRARDGRLWFPTIRGAVVYTPEHERTRTVPPPALIEELRVNGRPVPRSEWGRILAGNGRLELQFTAAGLRAPRRLRFRYQLEGIDAKPVEAGTQRVASYTRLPPGHYRFRVEVEYADGGGAAPVEVALYLQPRLHQTLTFRVACVLAAVLAVAGGVWLRLRGTRHREHELRAHVARRTAELAHLNEDLEARLEELQSTRERLVHAEKMAAVGTLAAGVGHELNNPLAFVISNVHYVASEVRDLAARGEERERWAEVELAISETLQGTERMRRIIQDLKTFSRVEPERDQRVEVHAVLELALTISAAEVRHRARVVKDLGPVPAVLGDETRLGQVFLNLLINAAQAIPEGQAGQHEIGVSTRQDAQGRVVVAVSDTGAGIPPEVLPRIFEPFFTTKPVGMGTGLGLSICHSYVQAMGGDIRVRSEVGRGTTFEVVLRSAEESASAAPLPPATASEGNGPRGRLMVIDDEPLLLATMIRTLAPGHEVEAFQGARPALERLRAGERYSLILCDVMMPEMTGLELYETLLREVPGQAERLVFLTGGAFSEAARAHLESTRRPCLDKPFEPEALRGHIQALLEAQERSPLRKAAGE